MVFLLAFELRLHDEIMGCRMNAWVQRDRLRLSTTKPNPETMASDPRTQGNHSGAFSAMPW